MAKTLLAHPTTDPEPMWNELKERPRRGKRALKPYASINPRGEIVLNAAVFPHLEGNY